VRPGHETSTQYFSFSGGPSAVCIKSALGHVTVNLCFCIRWDLRVMWCIPMGPGVKRRRTIFHARVGPVQIA
jgi:hypothetical protein